MQRKVQMVAFSTAILFAIHPTDVKAGKKLGNNTKEVISSEYENGLLRKFRDQQVNKPYDGDSQYGELTPDLHGLNKFKQAQLSFCSDFLSGTTIIPDSELAHRLFENEKSSRVSDPVDDSVTSQDFDAIDTDNFLLKLKNEQSTVEEKKLLLLNVPKNLLDNPAVCREIIDFVSYFGRQQDRIKLFKTLITRNINITDTTVDILHIAARQGADLEITFLLENGADINKKNLLKETPIDIAQRNMMFSTVCTLMENGAICNKEALLTWAIEKKDVNLIKQLVYSGAEVSEELISKIGHLGPNTQKFLKTAAALFTPLTKNFDSHILNQLNNNPDAAKNFTEILTFAGSRDQKYLENLFETIKFYFSQEERKTFNCMYENINELCLAVAKCAKSQSKKVAWTVKLFDICTGDIFEAGVELLPFETEVKTLVTDKKLFDNKTQTKLKDIYKKQLFNKQMHSSNKQNKFVDIAIKFSK